MEEDPRRVQFRRLLLLAAAAVVVFAGLKAAGDVLVPVVFAVFVSILGAPSVRRLASIGVPRGLAVGLVVLVISGVLVGGTVIIGDSVTRFSTRWPVYQEPLLAQLQQALVLLERFGFSPDEVMALIDFNALFNLVGQTLGALLATFSRVVLVLLYTTFILLETVQFEEKFKLAFAGNVEVSSTLVQGATSVQRYLAIKTATSLATGLLVGSLCAVLGLDFFVLWGVLAFVLNYIPTIGSIVAAIPAILLALVQLGLGWAIAVACVYVAVNFTIGSFLEPRILGRRLGLSPFVVILSLFFWGWMWGPAGMLLSVPMTVVVKLLLEISPETRWISVLLGGVREVAEMRRHPVEPPVSE